MSMIGQEPKVYDDGRTKQAFRDECDINKLLRKAQKTGSLSHLAKYQGSYGDFADVPDLLTAHNRLLAGQKMYAELPSEVRKQFPDMFKFFEFVNDSGNRARLRDIMPALAQEGIQTAEEIREAKERGIDRATPPAGPPADPGNPG